MTRGPERSSLTVIRAKDLLQTSRPVLTRRQFLVGGAALLADTTACSSTDGGYDLTPRLDTIYDKELSEKPDRGMQSVVFRYVRDRARGSISTTIQLTPRTPQEFRVVSREDSPRPGFLVDQAYKNDGVDQGGTTFEKYPVIELNPEDQETVFLGIGSGQETYKDMRIYQVFPKVDGGTIVGLRGRFNGLTTLQPPLQLRDS